MKKYINSSNRVGELRKLDNNTNMTQNEQLIAYIFIEQVVISKKLFIRKCKKCEFEWVSTASRAVYCEQCR